MRFCFEVMPRYPDATFRIDSAVRIHLNIFLTSDLNVFILCYFRQMCFALSALICNPFEGGIVAGTSPDVDGNAL
jgi:hypothetical protein